MTQLGVCPGSLSRITDLSQHASDGRKSEDGQFIAVEVLNIFGESTAAVEPGDRVLNYPAFWGDHKPFGLIRDDGDLACETISQTFQMVFAHRARVVPRSIDARGRKTSLGGPL